MLVAVDLRNLMDSSGKISGVENYSLNVLENLSAVNNSFFGFYNAFKDIALPKLASVMLVKSSRIPNKILNLSQRFLNFPKFEKLYGDFDCLWMPDLRPFAIGKKTKLAITVHDLSPIVHPEFYSWKRRIWHRLINHAQAFKRADLIFAVSEYTKNDLINLLGVNPEKIKVVYEGINHSYFNNQLDVQQLSKVKEKYNLPNKFILSVSTVEPRKNVLNLIRAFENIEDSQLQLVIAGKLGWLYEDLLKQAKASKKHQQIKFIGYVAESDKPYIISLARMLCYPSYYEGFGLVPLEAMACGVPVITSARSSMPEICADAALLVEPYQLTDLVYAIEQLDKDEKLRADFITKGLQRVQLFSWQKCAEQINQGLLELI